MTPDRPPKRISNRRSGQGRSRCAGFPFESAKKKDRPAGTGGAKIENQTGMYSGLITKLVGRMGEKGVQNRECEVDRDESVDVHLAVGQSAIAKVHAPFSTHRRR